MKFAAPIVADEAAQRNFDQLTGLLMPSSVTALPSPANDGQEVLYLADAANGVVWHLKYRAGSSSAFKWEVVGGPDLAAEVLTSQTTAATGYVDLTTAGPSLTLPLAGDWIVSHGAQIEATGTDRLFASPKFAAVATADANAVSVAVANVGAAAQGSSPARTQRVNGRAAGDVVKVQYRTALGTTGTFANRWLTVRPVRLG